MMDSFWSKVKKGEPNECWPWLGFKKSSGHGLTSYKSCPTHASRKAWILTYGSVPWDQCVNHRCDNAACCNPAHLYLGSRADNMRDYWGKIPADERKAEGRPFMLTDEQMKQLWAMRKAGYSLQECANKFHIHISTVCRYITAHRRARIEQLRAARLSRRA